jgi:hypothetical protein
MKVTELIGNPGRVLDNIVSECATKAMASFDGAEMTDEERAAVLRYNLTVALETREEIRLYLLSKLREMLPQLRFADAWGEADDATFLMLSTCVGEA